MNEKNIRAIDSPIPYEGRVTISFLKGKKSYKTIKVKNNGTNEFFRILCNAVVGNSVADLMPKYVDIVHVDTNSESKLNLVRPHYNTVNVSSVTNGGVTTYAAELVFVIPGSFLQSGEINEIRLFNSISDQAEQLAFIQLDSPITTDPDSNLMITWVISFGNGGE